jgi:hypothetical protein
VASGTMQHQGNAHPMTDNRATPMDRYKEMLFIYQTDMRNQINKIETCTGNLAKSNDRVALDALPMLHKIVSAMRSYQSNLLRSWERYEQNSTSP